MGHFILSILTSSGNTGQGSLPAVSKVGQAQHALAQGQEDPERLASLAQGSLVQKHDLLVQALHGRLKEHHRFLLKELLGLIEYQDRSVERLDRQIADRLRPFDEQITRIDEVTGLARRGIEIVLAELGTDMKQFPDAAHAASWVGICPGNP